MQTDVVIIGAGTAGLAAAREVRKKTRNFLIIDPGPLGTTCARVGCMPSKLLIEAANAYHRRLSFDAFGIKHADKLRVDMPAVMARVRELRDFYVDSTLKATNQFSDKLVAAEACLLGPQRILAGDRVIDCQRVIIATGSRPVMPEPWQQLGDALLTSDTVFEQQHFGHNIAVIGLGAIGLEIAQALSRLGLNVTAFGSQTMLAGLSEQRVNQALMASLQKEFALELGEQAALTKTDTGIRVSCGTHESVFDQVIAAVGRQPNLDNLGLENLELSLDSGGLPKIDPQTLQLGDLPVFIAGDVRGDRMLLHEASDDGRIAGHNAVATSVSAFCRRIPLNIVFCEPEVALVGQQRSQLQRGSFLVGEADFSRQGRARAAQINAGYLVVYADKDSGRLLGAEMAAPSAGHLAHLLGLAIQQQLSVNDMLAMPIYHPVLEEGLRTALRELQSQLPDNGEFTPSRCGNMGAEALD